MIVFFQEKGVELTHNIRGIYGTGFVKPAYHQHLPVSGSLKTFSYKIKAVQREMLPSMKLPCANGTVDVLQCMEDRFMEMSECRLPWRKEDGNEMRMCETKEDLVLLKNYFS